MNYRTYYQLWKKELNGTPYAQFLQQYENDETVMQDAFYKYLDFGTAGMRGLLGQGINRMNIFTVRRATKGLADYIHSVGGAEQGVAIAYDSRNLSKEFAMETACVLCCNKIKTYLYDTLTGVPQLSFAVRELNCCAGVAITASHNPAKYNGYKVYGSDGGQLASENANTVVAYIQKIDDVFGIETLSISEAQHSGYLTYLGKEINEQYYARVKELCINPDILAKEAKNQSIIYTPLYGTGNIPVTKVLGDLGVLLQVVKEQQLPDGNFPTVAAPNPEDPDAFTFAKELADIYGANLMLATDPDCDRLGVAVRKPDGQFALLSGNQIGCLLLEYILSQKKLTGDEFVVRSIVSSPLADKIAKAYGVAMRTVLTGFKYIAEQIAISEETGKGKFLFGFEESFGFLSGTFVRDKDACIAAMLIADVTCYYATQGKTLYDALQDLFAKYGVYVETVISITKEGKEGIEKITNVGVSLRNNPPKDFAGFAVTACWDIKSGVRKNADGEEEAIDLPSSDVLIYELACGSVVFRPSGTEPKLKAYICVSGSDEADAKEKFEALNTSVVALLQGILD